MFNLATIVEEGFEDQKTPIVRNGPSHERWCNVCGRTTRHNYLNAYAMTECCSCGIKLIDAEERVERMLKWLNE